MLYGGFIVFQEHLAYIGQSVNDSLERQHILLN